MSDHVAAYQLIQRARQDLQVLMPGIGEEERYAAYRSVSDVLADLAYRENQAINKEAQSNEG